MPRKHLASYLNDHLAGATTAVEMLEGLEKSHSGTELSGSRRSCGQRSRRTGTCWKR